MRVIAGDARGRSLEALPGTDVTRPTLSQVKEAMFSIVQFGPAPVHRAGVRPYTSSFEFAEPCVFDKQSPGPLRCALLS